MLDDLFSVADIITPNIPETVVLVEKITGKSVQIDSREKMEECAKILAEIVKNQCVLVKGGHFSECSDCLYFDGKIIWFEGKKVDTKNTRGTGCTLSAAIASNLALGFDMIESVKNAKDYVYNAILNDPKIGHGNGPVNHCWSIK
jgi:hydroxymethylpyrimidine/phosphomethylpyrimidine kinase